MEVSLRKVRTPRGPTQSSRASVLDPHREDEWETSRTVSSTKQIRRAASSSAWNEWSICRHTRLERARGHLSRNDETTLDIDPVVNPRIDPRLSRLAPHRKVPAALIRELGVQNESVSPRDTRVIARIG